MRHPFRDAGHRAVGLRDDDEINATIGESPENRHHLTAARMERIRDPHLNRLLAGSLSLFRAAPGSREYRHPAPEDASRSCAAACAATPASRSRPPPPSREQTPIELACRDRQQRIAAGEQPRRRLADAPPLPQQLQEPRRQHAVAVLPALALLDAEHHALASRYPTP